MALPPLTRFPLPGTAKLYALDAVQIAGTILPLDRPIEAGTALDVEKRKEPGSDYSTYVSHGLDSIPVRIALRLFRDVYSGKDWYADYLKVRDKLVAKQLSRRNAVSVYHPFLDEEGVNYVIFTKRSVPKHTQGHFFVVELEGYNPKTLRIGSGAGGTSKKVQQDKELGVGVRAAAKQSPQNVRTPAQNQVGRALPRSQTGGT